MVTAPWAPHHHCEKCNEFSNYWKEAEFIGSKQHVSAKYSTKNQVNQTAKQAPVVFLCASNKTYCLFRMTCELTSLYIIHSSNLNNKYSHSGTSFQWNAFTAVRCEEWDHYSQANHPLLQTTHANKPLQGWMVQQKAICKKAFTIKGQDPSFRCSSPCWHVACWCWMASLNVKGPPLASPV